MWIELHKTFVNLDNVFTVRFQKSRMGVDVATVVSQSGKETEFSHPGDFRKLRFVLSSIREFEVDGTRIDAIGADVN